MSDAHEPADLAPEQVPPEEAILDTATDAKGFTVIDVPPNPLDRLVERAKDDPGLPFTGPIRSALTELRRADRAAFETLRSRLKYIGVRVTALDGAMAAETGNDERRQSHADLLIEIAGDAELFHASDMTPLADVTIEGHRETWPVRSRGFRRWLTRAFYQRHGGAPSAEAVQAALGVMEAKAHYDAPERPIFLRIGEHDGKLYLDLCDRAWRAVEIDGSGWRVVSDPPCRFRRAAGMLPLPEPTPGGSVGDLHRFLNVANPADDADGADDPPGFVLAVAWLLAAFRATGPYPVLILAGEHGSAKSTFLLILRLMIDPNASALRSLPREDRDLFIAANNGHVMSFDNVSGLPVWISDTLCRLATGGGFAVRQLYTDQDEVLFDAMRPCALNGIEDVVSRPDLADRGLFLMLSPIPEERRRAQSELLEEIEAARPAILGALLTAMAHGLRTLPETRLDRLPRMADFALWATACEGGIGWRAGTFMASYDGNRPRYRRRDRQRPSRGGGARFNGRSGNAPGPSRTDRVEGNGQEPFSRPGSASGGGWGEGQNLAGLATGPRGKVAPGRDFPASLWD